MDFSLERLQKVLSILRSLRFKERIALRNWEARPLKEAKWKPFAEEDFRQGPGHMLFRHKLTIPKNWEGEAVALRFLWDPTSSAEGLLYLDDQLVQGVDSRHTEVIVAESAPKAGGHKSFLSFGGRVRGSAFRR